MSIYQKVKAKVQRLSPDEADKYLDKMYASGILTTTELRWLDETIFRMRVKRGEYD